MIRKDIDLFIKTLPDNVTLVAATKYVNSEVMKELINHGINNFGENRVNDFLLKYEELKGIPNICWHFIGHLQRNKAKQVIDKIDYLHSLDSLELAKIINEQRTTALNVFIEVSINLEENKNGVPYYELSSFVKELLPLKNIKIVGLMMMAKKSSGDEYEQFIKLANLKKDIEDEFDILLPYLSMGMSDDYPAAIKAGATHIRLGRILFN